LSKQKLEALVAHEFYQGEYQAENPEKIILGPGGKKPFFRSSYEKRFMRYCDINKNVLRYGNEIVKIPYIDMTSNNKVRTYITDFIMTVLNKEGGVDTYLVEIKPKSQVPQFDEEGNFIFPQPSKRKTKKTTENWQRHCSTLVQNHCKWEAARAWCATKGYKFLVLTEDELDIKR